MIKMLRVGSPAATSLRPGASPAQAPASERGAAPSAQESISLEPSKPVERELSGGQSHSYRINMTSGQYLRITVSQRGIDVLVALFIPDGKKIGEVDSEQATVGAETISAIAVKAGAYRIEVRSVGKTTQTGRYEIKVEELREVTAEDKYRVAAESALLEAKQLENGTSEDKRKGIGKYQEALELYRRAGDRKGEAEALNGIGGIYESLGGNQKALEKYNEALPVRRAVGDRWGEAVTLNDIGVVHMSLGEMQKAREKFNEALAIKRTVGDRRAEAVILSSIGAIYSSSGEMQKALELLNQALTIHREVGNRNGEAGTLHFIGNVYTSSGEIQKALEKYNEALPIRRAVGDRYGEADTLLGLARLERRQGNLTQARQIIEQAIDIVESARVGIRIQDLRASFFASRQECYEFYIDILMKQHKQNPAAGFDVAAFAVSERARARSLLELLTESRADLRQGVDGSLLKRERSLQRLLNAKAAAQFALLNRKHSPAQAETFAKEIASLTTKYEELRA